MPCFHRSKPLLHMYQVQLSGEDITTKLEKSNLPGPLVGGPCLLCLIVLAVQSESRPIFFMNLENAPALEEAIIPVEKINGPVLLISGQDDRVWPSSLMSEMVIKRLKEHNHPHFFMHLSYKGAGHNIGVPYGSTTAITFRHPITGTVFSLGGNAKDNAFSKVNSWPQVLKFLENSFND